MSHIPNQNKQARVRRGEAPVPKSPPHRNGAVATIREMLEGDGPNWFWAHCTNTWPRCEHHSAITLAQFAIRWGLDASGDMIRKCLVCSRCRHVGAQLVGPSRGAFGQVRPFPIEDIQAAPRYALGMCNLYSVTKGQVAIREITRALQDRTGNMPTLPAIFPDQMAPIVRGIGQNRELVMARWGFPPPAIPGSKSKNPYLTNVRNSDSRYWLPWLTKPEHRCLVPVTSFAEPDNTQGPRSIWTWFARDESRPLMFFAGIWREWEGERGPKVKREVGKHLIFGFLTTDASPDVAPVHPDATPVLLLDEVAREAWLNAPWEEARSLQKPPPAGALRVVAKDTKQDNEIE